MSRQVERVSRVLFLEREQGIAPRSAFLGLGGVLDNLEFAARREAIHDSIEQRVVGATCLRKCSGRSLASGTVEIQHLALIGRSGEVDDRCQAEVKGSERKVVTLNATDYGHDASVALGGVSTVPSADEVVHLLQLVEGAAIHRAIANRL